MHEICAVFFTFQQCNAPAAAHRAWETINLLELLISVLLSFHHISIWQVHQVNDVDELKQRLINVCHGFEQSVISDAGDKWHKRISMGICAKVGHFEYLL